MKIQIANTAIRTVWGDITKVDFADVIVNSVGSTAHSGKGVNAAILNAAGLNFNKYYIKEGGCKTGKAIITPSCKLPCKAVIHTMGPVWKDGSCNEVALLESCYKESMRLAEAKDFNSIAFPSISTGYHGFPIEKAAYIAVHAVVEYLYIHRKSFTDIYWVLFDEITKSAYDSAFAILSKEFKLDQTEDNYDIIGFYHEYDPYGCFSNWYPAEFEYAGKKYANSEQYMMYQKVMMFGRKDLADKIMKTTNPMECKKIAGQKFPEFNAVTWESTCYTIVKRGVRAKLIQNPSIKGMLLKTGNALLAECSPNDKKWGIGLDNKNPDWKNIAKWNGKNLLGRILMEVRDDFRKWPSDYYSIYKKVHLNAYSSSPSKEWDATAAVLERLPKYHATIHAYADTLRSQKDRDRFYHQCSLYEWELQMKINNGGGLPEAGFYEMKQEIYEITQGY